MPSFFVELFNSHSSRNFISLSLFSVSSANGSANAPLFASLSNRDGSLLEGRGFLSFFPLRILLLTLLLLPVLFSSARTSIALRAFLHRITGAFLFLHLSRFLSSTVLRFGSPVSSSLLAGALDDLGLLPRFFLFLATLLLALFFFATAERSLVAFRVGEREFPVLLLLLHLGGAFALYLSTTRELFLALERVTLASYVLIAFERQNRFSTFAGLHYFLLGAVPSGILLLSFAFFYLFGGSLVLQERDLLFVPAAVFAFPSAIYSLPSRSPVSLASPFAFESHALATAIETSSLDLVSGGAFFEDLLSVTNPLIGVTTRAVVFLVVNFFFKITAAPVHFWAPTVYGYGPLPAVTILSIYGKVRVFFLLIKLSLTFLHAFGGVLAILVVAAGVRSVLSGRLGAFPETTLKRFFVFSSRGHVGYRLLSFAVQDVGGLTASLQYLVVYSLSALLGWSFLLTRGRSAWIRTSLAALKFKDPFLAVLFALTLFSRSGIPPLGGFFVKLDVFSVLLSTGQSFLAALLLLLSVGSFFYYLRRVKILLFDAQSSTSESFLEQRLHAAALVRESASVALTTRLPLRLTIRSALFCVLAFYIVLVHPVVPVIIAEVIQTAR